VGVRVPGTVRILLILVPLCTTANRLHAHQLQSPDVATQEVNRCLRLVNIAASRKQASRGCAFEAFRKRAPQGSSDGAAQPSRQAPRARAMDGPALGFYYQLLQEPNETLPLGIGGYFETPVVPAFSAIGDVAFSRKGLEPDAIGSGLHSLTVAAGARFYPAEFFAKFKPKSVVYAQLLVGVDHTSFTGSRSGSGDTSPVIEAGGGVRLKVNSTLVPFVQFGVRRFLADRGEFGERDGVGARAMVGVTYRLQ
jgi:hypothetical protein